MLTATSAHIDQDQIFKFIYMKNLFDLLFDMAHFISSSVFAHIQVSFLF